MGAILEGLSQPQGLFTFLQTNSLLVALHWLAMCPDLTVAGQRVRDGRHQFIIGSFCAQENQPPIILVRPDVHRSSVVGYPR